MHTAADEKDGISPAQCEPQYIGRQESSVDSLTFHGDGAGNRIRTRDIRSTKPALYQLSYTSVHPRLSGVSAPWPLEQFADDRT